MIGMSKPLKFTEQMRRLIEASGETRYRIAVECGIDHAAMSRFMSGKAGLSLPSLDALAEYLRWEIVARPKPEKTTKRKGEK